MSELKATLLAALLVGCTSDDIPPPPRHPRTEYALKGVDLPPIYLPWTPDTAIGEPIHLGYLKEFGFKDTTDTIVHWQGLPRLTLRWLEDGFHVREGRDTSYSLLSDSVPEPLFFEVSFIASGTELD